MDLSSYGITPTPLVRLERVAPPGVTILAKCEWHLPTGSLKDRVAAAMTERAKAEGRLEPGIELLEPSSGNTGIALARIAALHGIPLTVVVPDDVSRERLELLEAYGAKLHLTPGEEGSNGAVRRAETLAGSGRYLLLHQYENEANPVAHAATTGPEIIAQAERIGIDRIGVLVATLGTGGTLMGVGRALRHRWPDVRIIAAEPPSGELIAGLRSLEDGYIPPIFDAERIDGRTLVRTREAIAMTRRLLTEEGLFTGPSSGAAVHAAVKAAAKLQPGDVVVTVLPDAGWKYLSAGIFSGTLEEATERVLGTTLW